MCVVCRPLEKQTFWWFSGREHLSVWYALIQKDLWIHFQTIWSSAIQLWDYKIIHKWNIFSWQLPIIAEVDMSENIHKGQTMHAMLWEILRIINTIIFLWEELLYGQMRLKGSCLVFMPKPKPKDSISIERPTTTSVKPSGGGVRMEGCASARGPGHQLIRPWTAF